MSSEQTQNFNNLGEYQYGLKDPETLFTNQKKVERAGCTEDLWHETGA